MKKLGIFLTLLFMGMLFISNDAKAQDSGDQRIKAEIRRHAEAIKRLEQNLGTEASSGDEWYADEGYSDSGTSGEAGGPSSEGKPPLPPRLREKLEDRREDIREMREERREDRRDRLEDLKDSPHRPLSPEVKDRIEDKMHQGGPRDKLEDIRDRKEDFRDSRRSAGDKEGSLGRKVGSGQKDSGDRKVGPVEKSERKGPGTGNKIRSDRGRKYPGAGNKMRSGGERKSSGAGNKTHSAGSNKRGGASSGSKGSGGRRR